MGDSKRLFISARPYDIFSSCFASLTNYPADPKDALLVNVFNCVTEDETHITSCVVPSFASLATSLGCKCISLDIDTIPYSDNLPHIANRSLTEKIQNEIGQALLPIVQSFVGKGPIYLPLGSSDATGFVRNAVLRILREIDMPHPSHFIIYYECLPELLITDESTVPELAQDALGDTAGSLLVDLDGVWEPKRSYSTQIVTYFGPEILETLLRYAQRLGGVTHKAERVWFHTDQEPPIVQTVAWVNWEAARSLGGYAAVLKNLQGNASYQKAVGRTLLISPLYMPVDSAEYKPVEDVQSIARKVKADIVYPVTETTSGLLSSIAADMQAEFREVEARHGVDVYYLRDRSAEAHRTDRILINLSGCITPRNIYSRTLSRFLVKLRREMGIAIDLDIRHRTPFWESTYGAKAWTGLNPADNAKDHVDNMQAFEADPRSYYHQDNDSLFGLLLAEPAAECLKIVLGQKESCALIALDSLSLPAAYAIHMDQKRLVQPSIRTLYYTGDVVAIRNLATGALQPNVAMYEVAGFDWEGPIRTLIRRSLEHAEGTPGDFTNFKAFRSFASHYHLQIVRNAWRLDKTFVLSDNVRDELHFIDHQFRQLGTIPTFCPGICQIPCQPPTKERCRRLLLSYASIEWDLHLDPHRTIIATHIGRAVPQKAYYRDTKLIRALGKLLAGQGYSIFLLIVTAWKHDGPQLIRKLQTEISDINMNVSNVRIRMVNSYDWPSTPELGYRSLAMTRVDVHRATDLSLCLSLYDTFAIAPLEPLSCGATVVVSTACGCARRIAKLNNYEQRIVLADYTEGLEGLVGTQPSVTAALLATTFRQKTEMEDKTSIQVATRVLNILPKTPEARELAIKSGSSLARQMDWDVEITNSFVPILRDMFRSEEMKNGD